MNVVYYVAVRSLEHDEKNPRRPRQQLDNSLDITAWSVAGGKTKRVERDEGAPTWWHGDAEASQSFFSAMGVIEVG